MLHKDDACLDPLSCLVWDEGGPWGLQEVTVKAVHAVRVSIQGLGDKIEPLGIPKL